MERYDHKIIEHKWQKYWEQEKSFAVDNKGSIEHYYVLDMFPYPSAQGLHVGHPEGMTATDIYCRHLRMKGVNVLHPMGWDAFGLPAENYAIKTGRHPNELTLENIDNFRRQIKSLGFSYDWSREINTADPAYYKWTQWLFLKLYEKGLAYQKEAPVNWCPSCQTVLANEQVVPIRHGSFRGDSVEPGHPESDRGVGGECERCHNQVEQRKMKQWFFKITTYADELLNGLDVLDWPENIKEMQRNWIGKSEGAEVEFRINNPCLASRQEESKIKIFTTRLDTIFGATYLVLAPEHELVQQLKDQIKNWSEVEKYIKTTQQKTELERKAETKEKTGVRLEGIMAINPANNEEIPIFIADYVLTSYGTGAIMAVPAHDERDFEFAKKFKLPIRCVIQPTFQLSGTSHLDMESKKEGAKKEIGMIVRGEQVYVGEGRLMNSIEFNHLSYQEAVDAISKKIGAEFKTQYRLRDWLISRQRYWGAPIPIIYCEACSEVSVPEKDLPVELPMDVDFRPTGESPLVRSKSFHNVKCPKCGEPAKRESDTMDTFVDSSWYFLRYCDPQNNKKAFADKKVNTWCPVDFYVGGAEHAVMHLLYARFITKAMADLGNIKFREPFLKLRNQGLILGEDGQKMSKSRGNVVNPDEIVEKYGADTLRLYEMFMGPLEESKPWNTSSIIGLRRFLEKVHNFSNQLLEGNIKLELSNQAAETSALRARAQAIKRVTDDIKNFRFNTAISALMEFNNVIISNVNISRETKITDLHTLLILLYPFAPHLASELWEKLNGNKEVIWQQAWPTYDEFALAIDKIKIVVQVNGKVRAQIECATNATEPEIIKAAREDVSVDKYLDGKELKRTVYVPGKLVNFVL